MVGLMMESIEIVFTLSRDEYMRAIRRHYKSHLHTTRDLAIGIVATAVGLILVWSGFVFAWVMVATSVVLLAAVVYALFILPALIYRSEPKLKSEYRMRFSEEDIGFQTDDMDSIIKWSLYQSWISDGDFYVMYYGKRSLSVIPRRAFHSKDEDARFADLLTRKIRPA